MDNSPTTTTDVSQESPKRFLDPFAEWRDHGNKWDVTELLRKKPEQEATAKADKESVT